MFSIGVEFSLQELLRVRKVAVFGAPAGIILIILMAFLTGTLLGWPVSQRLVVGATISACSTMVLVKFLQDRGEVNSTHGRIVVGIALLTGGNPGKHTFAERSSGGTISRLRKRLHADTWCAAHWRIEPRNRLEEGDLCWEN